MKKFILCLSMCVAMCGTSFSADNSIAEKVVLYLPNRVVDAFDTFSVNVGFGPVVRAELMCTYACRVGVGVGATAKLFKDFNRQYGYGLQQGFYWSFISIGQEDIERKNTSDLVKKYWEQSGGFQNPMSPVYDFHEGARDYWQIGGALGFLIEGEVYLHPVEFVDFVLGFFFIDVRDDDIRIEDFQR